MHLFCPSCHSTKMKKNGHTHYGKQNHQCKDCGRQFVLNNQHTKSEYVKELISKSLKERLSLRATCRVFGVSLNWLYAFAKVLRSCNFETDNWEAYRSIIPLGQHRVGKDLTCYIEDFNATIRVRVSRLVRKALSFSKLDKWHNHAIRWFFWQFNLERQHYI